MGSLIQSVAIGSHVKGLRKLIRGAVDDAGTYWPAGTEFQAGCAGRDNLIDRDYQMVVIKGRKVRFVR